MKCLVASRRNHVPSQVYPLSAHRSMGGALSLYFTSKHIALDFGLTAFPYSSCVGGVGPISIGHNCREDLDSFAVF